MKFTQTKNGLSAFACRWMTSDVHMIRPSAGNLATDNAFVYALRVNFTF
ncbi:MAG: hypothetical protein ACLQIB_54475 [Isosphaeraceae bacterium]